MKKEFVTYEQSLVLKELGYDERCFGHYNPNGVFFWKILCSDEDNDHTLSVKDIMEHVADGYVEAPLYQQAFRWFREKYDLSSWISGRTTMGFSYTIDASVGNFVYNTHEEAEQACLDKLIELIKTK